MLFTVAPSGNFPIIRKAVFERDWKEDFHATAKIRAAARASGPSTEPS